MTPGSRPQSDDQLHLEADPLWYQDAVIYQLHVRAFADSDGDGIGDFRGLVDKLDYLHDLGVTALWLLPFYPSPLRDDGYDIADYRTVNPAYGTIRDFQAFLRAAHRRGLRVITELVVNHTSDAHPWFQRARRAPAESRWRNFYVWSETPERYRDARIIFQDFEHSNWSWDPVASSYYWHRFYSHQPDLNYESADVRRLISRTLNYWLGLGVDGLRLDAVPYLFEREGTSCENLPETHAFLKELRRYVDDGFENRMLLAEANQWPEDAVAYFGDGDECHMAFHFPVMPRLFMAIQMEDRFPLIDILEQTPEIPSASQWAVFLRNHDELTLEMVTDEERDYMYRVYAHDRQARINLGIRRRLAPLLGNNRAKIELMNGLLLSLPGTPIIYYGDEIGMGDNIYLGDRDGVRTPMQWSSDRNAGFSRGNPQRLFLPVIIDPEFHYETVNVEAQQHNPQSLLGWMRRLISLRNRSKVFGRGSIDFLTPENHRVLAFVRRYEDERVLVVANLSRHAQYVELDLSEFEGSEPLELFGQTSFPRIGELPYLLTLGPHAFYWFALEVPRVELPSAPLDTKPPTVQVAGRWENAFRGRARKPLEAAIQQYLERRRWFAGKARRLESISLGDVVPVPMEHAPAAAVAVVEAHYVEGEPETYVLPLMIAVEERMEHVLSDLPQATVTLLELRGQPGVLFEAVYDQDFCQTLLDTVRRRRRFRGSEGAMAGRPTPVLRRIIGEATDPLAASVSSAEQSNSSVIYGNQLILKLFRRVEDGLNPDLEIGRFLTDRTDFSHAPAVTGALEYRVGRGEPTTFAIVHEIVPNEGDAWSYTLDELSRYFERILRDYEGEIPPQRPTSSFVDLARAEVPELIRAESEAYLQAAELMGRRTAELHIALASDRTDEAFAPEDFTPLYQRSAYQSMRNLTRRNIQLLRGRLSSLPEVDRPAVERVISLEPDLLDCFRIILERKLTGQRTRYHGDFHLGQVLYTGNDFFIIDFEGEPARSLADRRVKRSPLRDVAGMVRSFDYATHAALRELIGRGVIEASSEQASRLETWGRFWYRWVGASYLRAYLDRVEGYPFIPRDQEELRGLLAAFTLEKAVYEVGYELNSRPDWVRIPVSGIHELVEQPG